MSVPNKVVELVERFHADRKTYLSPAFKEEWIIQDFISPLFEVLGWDVGNKRGVPMGPYREVIPEDRIKVGGATKAPDLGFYLGGARRFFVEAKKPSVSLAGDISPAFQLRRYAWSAKLPLSILTDFEELVTYDCRYEPKRQDGPATARLQYMGYEEYPDRWDEIASIFSKEAVLSGSLEKYAEETKRKRGTQTVDDAFLKEIESWRDALARNLALRNNLNQRQLNYAVQMTIDRIIFLRMAEDRGVEEYKRLWAVLDGTNVYGRLCDLFREADDRYNSGLFHFRQERNRAEEPDQLTLGLEIEDKVLKEIIRGLYYPDSPYEFSVLPIDVLGQVYEQFLGKVIRLTESGHRAVVEEKPEVRKAGGVYYTPNYIVDYIVENTVGKLLEGKKPGPTGGASKLKIVDPACGSGSFLIGAYTYLLDWHRDRYLEDGPEKHQKVLYQGQGGEWRLTIDEKKRILTKNIYGVDIDPQAVEVTKLSLLLKVLEGETNETLESQLRLFAERALPDLDNNIKCGNSLIGRDFYEDEQMMLLDKEEHYRVNVFDWEFAFPQVFGGDKPGFDAVIGNPPYVRTLHFARDKQYYKRRYLSAYGAYDIYVLFMEAALRLLNNSGIVGLITPNKYFVADYASKIRHVLLTEANIVEIADLGKCKSVFADALISTAITFYMRGHSSDRIKLKILSDANVQQISEVPVTEVSRESIVTPQGVIRVYQDISSNAILEKISACTEPLKRVAEVRTGVMGFDYWAMDECISDDNTGRRIATNSYIGRYQFLWGKKVRLYKREVFEPRLSTHCEVLNENTLVLFRSHKIVVRGVARRLTAMLDEEGIGILVAVHSVVGKRYQDKFLLGLLNSKLFNWLHVVQYYSARIPEGSLRYPVSFLNDLPIRTINFSDHGDVARHDRMVELVERMLALHERLAEARIERERIVIQRQIDATDRQIDGLVYELYGLADEEIETVEAETRHS